MPARKYYCDYCDKMFQDTPSDRKRHVRGIQHQHAKARWYDSFKIQPQQGPLSDAPICFQFVNTGFCLYGNSCKYTHPNPNNTVNTQPAQGSVVQDRMGVSWGNLPPSLHPPPEGGYPLLPFVDWC